MEDKNQFKQTGHILNEIYKASLAQFIMIIISFIKPFPHR